MTKHDRIFLALMQAVCAIMVVFTLSVACDSPTADKTPCPDQVVVSELSGVLGDHERGYIVLGVKAAEVYWKIPVEGGIDNCVADVFVWDRRGIRKATDEWTWYNVGDDQGIMVYMFPGMDGASRYEIRIVRVL